MDALAIGLMLLSGLWSVLEFFWHYRFTLFALIALYQLEVIMLNVRAKIPLNLPRAIGDLEQFLEDQRRQQHRAMDAQAGFFEDE